MNILSRVRRLEKDVQAYVEEDSVTMSDLLPNLKDVELSKLRVSKSNIVNDWVQAVVEVDNND